MGRDVRMCWSGIEVVVAGEMLCLVRCDILMLSGSPPRPVPGRIELDTGWVAQPQRCG